MLYLSCEKNENKQKETGFGPFKKPLLTKNICSDNVILKTSIKKETPGMARLVGDK